MHAYIRFADALSAWVAKAFAWCVMVMIARRLLRGLRPLRRCERPTVWAFDISYMMYGTLFMLGGAYTLSRDAHVRADIFFRLMTPRAQAALELVLYFLFFFPGILALIFAGWKYVSRSWRYHEVSTMSPANIPIFQFKTVIIVAGVLLFIQGIAQVMRCIICLQDAAHGRRRRATSRSSRSCSCEEAEPRGPGHSGEAVDVVPPIARRNAGAAR